ncbi:hypothetical protein [Intestinimonas massiliensis (ex Afouda et al. 2020)]|uniref:hypothetical protein n=1 Tax=Intestinimonas massiliensis (ex Afouda et al. 2020) TaxID=1673721 RepID=UPI00102F643D|nr:hypothetical protein [Intestinimonas massiliensis (ex Afouda et al. 2020)]
MTVVKASGIGTFIYRAAPDILKIAGSFQAVRLAVFLHRVLYKNPFLPWKSFPSCKVQPRRLKSKAGRSQSPSQRHDAGDQGAGFAPCPWEPFFES